MNRVSASPAGSALRAWGAIAGLMLAGLTLIWAPAARALPSYARQTGQQCVACHNGFPELTPYGRQFKLNGYTLSTFDAPKVPVAALIIETFTHTEKALAQPIVPTTKRNNNLETDAANVYYAGKITPHVGAFVQALWSPLTHRLQLFTTDVRYSNSARLFGHDTTYGLSFNNDPGITDPWNTAQSFWTYPYETSHVIGGPEATTAIQGRYRLQIVGANAYASWNRLVYADVGLYSSVGAGTLNDVGITSRGASAIDGEAPYWRLAVEPAWGHSTLELGTFGLYMNVDPHRITSAGTDHTLDVGFDTQYQYMADRHSFSVTASDIIENSTLNASKTLGFSTNRHDSMNAVNIKATYIYDQTYGGNLGYFQTTGSRDQDLYGAASAGGRPNTSGWITEVDYYPFDRGGPKFWRELNFKLGLQYTYYTSYDGGAADYGGTGRSASDNNTLFLYAWSVF
jgi:hypothetical protein